MQFVVQDMELYNSYIVLYGMKDLVPVVVMIDVKDSSKEPFLLVLVLHIIYLSNVCTGLIIYLSNVCVSSWWYTSVRVLFVHVF